ncbi:hypothetical protein [Stygiolobus caldivivus]|uniref:Uncharacterized protein n=1 Tax=Stygiolobus caldivivus TaxID=2824673 RepID=A0A8D5U768_9CREN|nr:hypothetical protein [Stygiolobus caldivivus]BCU70252.1 hypothetical protein KN1_15490 [Stygiolobus caldivivus]
MIGKIIGILFVILVSLTTLGFYYNYIKIQGSKLVISIPTTFTERIDKISNTTKISYSHFIQKNVSITLCTNSSNFTYTYTVQPISNHYNIAVYSTSHAPFVIKLLNANDSDVIFVSQGKTEVNLTLSNISYGVKIEVLNISSTVWLDIVTYS